MKYLQYLKKCKLFDVKFNFNPVKHIFLTVPKEDPVVGVKVEPILANTKANLLDTKLTNGDIGQIITRQFNFWQPSS